MPQAAHPLDLLIRKLEQHSALDAADRDAIRSLPYAFRTLEPHSYIIREGDAPTHCAVLVSGFAYRQKTTGEGSRQILSVHIPGEPLDAQNLFLDESDHSVQTLGRAEVALVPRPELQKLALARPAIGRALNVVSLVEASIFREWVLNVGRRDARSRLAHVLCEFATRMKAQGLANGDDYELPMTQEQLGDATGLTPVHVNRTLKTLETEGLIVRNRRHVKFTDWEALRGVADFNQRYLHLQPQKAGGGGRPSLGLGASGNDDVRSIERGP